MKLIQETQHDNQQNNDYNSFFPQINKKNAFSIKFKGKNNEQIYVLDNQKNEQVTSIQQQPNERQKLRKKTLDATKISDCFKKGEFRNQSIFSMNKEKSIYFSNKMNSINASEEDVNSRINLKIQECQQYQKLKSLKKIKKQLYTTIYFQNERQFNQSMFNSTQTKMSLRNQEIDEQSNFKSESRNNFSKQVNTIQMFQNLNNTQFFKKNENLTFKVKQEFMQSQSAQNENQNIRQENNSKLSNQYDKLRISSDDFPVKKEIFPSIKNVISDKQSEIQKKSEIQDQVQISRTIQLKKYGEIFNKFGDNQDQRSGVYLEPQIESVIRSSSILQNQSQMNSNLKINKQASSDVESFISTKQELRLQSSKKIDQNFPFNQTLGFQQYIILSNESQNLQRHKNSQDIEKIQESNIIINPQQGQNFRKISDIEEDENNYDEKLIETNRSQLVDNQDSSYQLIDKQIIENNQNEPRVQRLSYLKSQIKFNNFNFKVLFLQQKNKINQALNAEMLNSNNGSQNAINPYSMSINEKQESSSNISGRVSFNLNQKSAFSLGNLQQKNLVQPKHSQLEIVDQKFEEDSDSSKEDDIENEVEKESGIVDNDESQFLYNYLDDHGKNQIGNILVKKNKMSKEMMVIVKDTINFIDNYITNQKNKVILKKRQYKDPLLFENAQKADSNQLVNYEPSNLDRLRARVNQDYNKEIKQLMNQIDSVMDNQEDDDKLQKAAQIFEELKDKDQDQDINQKMNLTKIETAQLIGIYINEVYSKSQKLNHLKNLQEQLKQTIEKRFKFDQDMKRQIQIKNQRNQKFAQKNKDCKLTSGILKFQNVVKYKIMNKGMRFKLLFQKLGEMIADSEKKQRKKEKNRLQKFVRKHFMQKKQKFLDIKYIIHVVNFQQVCKQIFKDQNIGKVYKDQGINFWKNEFIANMKQILKAENLKQENTLEEKQIDFNDLNLLYEDQIVKKQFYEQAKQGKIAGNDDINKEFYQNYYNYCQNNQIVPQPAFSCIFKNILFFYYQQISVEMSQALRQYFKDSKNDSSKIIESIFIDECGMKDKQFSNILMGIKEQGNHLSSLVYSNNDIGYESLTLLADLVPNLKLFNINKIQNGFDKFKFSNILDSSLENGIQLQKLKISNTNINDFMIVDKICKMIATKEFLTHLDLSWASLSPKQLSLIAGTLNEHHEQIPLRNLNLSYNSLYSNEDNIDFKASQEFVQNISDYIRKSQILNHLDISGMNISQQQIMTIAEEVANSETILGFHLNDNGIQTDPEALNEILDIFGLDSQIFQDPKEINFINNLQVVDPQNLQFIIKQLLNFVETSQVLDENAKVDPHSYKKHLFQQKQGKMIINNKILNQQQSAQGYGRLESSSFDKFILYRRVNQPELIFNQQIHKDMYFEKDSSLNWQVLSQQNQSVSGCPVCLKHKFTLIFYEQNLDPELNQNLYEIKNQDVVNKIKKTLNLKIQDENEIAPIICGTVVNGGFKRKLRMLRGDLFSMLLICQSKGIIDEQKQGKQIKEGIIQYVNKTQDIQHYDESILAFKGWEDKLIIDYVLNNDLTDVYPVNFQIQLKKDKIINDQKSPNVYKRGKKKPEVVTTFIYAAYLPPGQHQFLIYCPKTNRAFYKDLLIDLSKSDAYPEQPKMQKNIDQIKQTKQNIWRNWKQDSELNKLTAIQQDFSQFDIKIHVESEDEVNELQNVCLQYFDIIKAAFSDGISKSKELYPLISNKYIIETMAGFLDVQEEEELNLKKSEIKQALMIEKRGVKIEKESFNRGQFIESIIKLSKYFIKQDQKISLNLKNFLDKFLKEKYVKTLQINDQIRKSKKLNLLLHQNRHGLLILYTEKITDQNLGFTYESAQQLFNQLASKKLGKDEDLVKDMKLQFILCQMTILKESDYINQRKYFNINYVEFLDLICRISISYWAELHEEEECSLEEKVDELLMIMWQKRKATKQPKKSKQPQVEFPEYLSISNYESD